MHQPVQDGRSHGGIAQVAAPVLHHAVGSHHDGAAQLVALVHDHLQHLGGVPADAPGQEQVVQDEQVRLHPLLEERGALGDTGQRVTGELGIGLQVAHVKGSTLAERGS